MISTNPNKYSYNLHQQPTPNTYSYRKATAPRSLQSDLLTHMANLRLLQDQLFSQRVKNQTLQRKNMEYIQTIGQLQYSVSDLKYMLERAQLEINRHKQIDREVDNYAINLKQVGQELVTLNQILEKKNRDCSKLINTNNTNIQSIKRLEQKIYQIQQQYKQVNAKCVQILHILEPELYSSYQNNNITMNNLSNMSINNTSSLLHNVQLIEQSAKQLHEQCTNNKYLLQKHIKQSSQNMIKQKQNLISVQYQLKLCRQRNIDLQKKKAIDSSLILDKRVQDIIQQMLKKQDQLNAHIVNLQEQVQQLRDQLQNQRSSSKHYMTVSTSDNQKQLKIAKQAIRQITIQNSRLKQRVQTMQSERQTQKCRILSQNLESDRKCREIVQENHRLKVKVKELEADRDMLEKEIRIR